MLWIIAIVLGVIQGIGEFLPISSSAHLIISRWLFGWDEILKGGGNIEIAFDVALHLGTLIAVLLYFYQDWIEMIKAGFKNGLKTKDGKMFWYLILATIPAGVVGLLLEHKIEEIFRGDMLVIAAGLAIMGVVLYLVDKICLQKLTLQKITLAQAVIIGCCQTLALIPGVSRSGITMTTARALGFTREAAAKFSFFLATPIIAGAAVKHFADIITHLFNPLFWVGTLVSAVVGLFCIGFLLKYLQKNNFAIFALYRIALSIVIVIVYYYR